MTQGHRITAIERQKKKKRRCSIYLDGEFAFGVNEDVVVLFSLRKGDILDAGRIRAIKAAETRADAKEKALLLLSYRARSVEEMRARLAGRGFDPSVTDPVIEDLCRVGLLDDTRFASAYARSRLIQRPMGRRLLVRELLARGVNEETAIRAAGEAYEESEEILARRLARKRLDGARPGLKELKKLSDFLYRRGFEWELIQRIISETGTDDSDL